MVTNDRDESRGKKDREEEKKTGRKAAVRKAKKCATAVSYTSSNEELAL